MSKESNERIIKTATGDFKLKCPLCGGERFYVRKTLLNTSLMTYFDLDWLNKEATNYVCDNCSYTFWFADDQYTLEGLNLSNENKDPVKAFEEKFENYNTAKLQKIIEGDSYYEDAKTAARNLLAKAVRKPMK